MSAAPRRAHARGHGSAAASGGADAYDLQFKLLTIGDSGGRAPAAPCALGARASGRRGSRRLKNTSQWRLTRRARRRWQELPAAAVHGGRRVHTRDDGHGGH